MAKVSLPRFPRIKMRQFLINLIEKNDPQPAGKEFITSMINAGEVGIAVETIAENYYEFDVALIAEEQLELKSIGKQLNLSKHYLEIINDLTIVAS